MAIEKKVVPTHPGELGEHPVGGAVGAIVGASAGAAAVGAAEGAVLGAAVGPLGMAAGIAVGAVAGALAGKGAAQMFNPTTEDAYWAQNHSSRPYVTPGESYDTYRPAYRYGAEAYGKYGASRPYSEVEADLRTDWEKSRGTSNLSWDKARPATRDAYDRLYNLNKDSM